MKPATSKVTSNSLEIRQFIRAPREKVYHAWTDPVLGKQWCPAGMKMTFIEGELRVGGRYRTRMEGDAGVFTNHGVYREIVPGHKLVHTFEWEGDDPVETLVTIEFKDKDGGTEVVLRQEGFTDPDEPALHAQGWGGSLGKLARGLGGE